MSRKRRAPKKIPVVDPKYKSVVIPKLINSIMFDGKKMTAEKIVYDAIEKIKTKSKDEPLTVFNDAINNVRPTVEVRSRRVGGATYQVPVEVNTKRSQTFSKGRVRPNRVGRSASLGYALVCGHSSGSRTGFY